MGQAVVLSLGHKLQHLHTVNKQETDSDDHIFTITSLLLVIFLNS